MNPRYYFGLNLINGPVGKFTILYCQIVLNPRPLPFIASRIIYPACEMQGQRSLVLRVELCSTATTKLRAHINIIK